MTVHELRLISSRRETYLCRSQTSRRTWWTPGCRSSSSPSLSAAAPAEPSALSAPSAGVPSSALHAHPAPAASERRERTERERRRQQWSIVCKLFKSGRTVYLSVASTFMWSWARLSRLRVVFLMESDDRGTCFLSCSRQCLSWARLQSTTSNNRRCLIHARDERMFICCSLRHIAIKRSLYLFFSSSLWTDLQSQKETSVFSSWSWWGICALYLNWKSNFTTTPFLVGYQLCNTLTYCHQQLSSCSSVCFSCQRDLGWEAALKHIHVLPLCKEKKNML